MHGTIRDDIGAVFENDPAARNILEVLMCYPGLHAIVIHRFNHSLHKLGVPLIPRMISNAVRLYCGIDIHPGAAIGKKFVIDHGVGVVIGETAEIGDNVLMYQGATLGGTGKHTGKRHPTIGNNVVIGAGAKVLGPLSVGDFSRVGAGAVVVKDVPAHSTVVGVPARVVRIRGKKEFDALEHGAMPDVVEARMRELEARIAELEKAHGKHK
jgi:serine O-acetyltransferase